ncbi:FH2 domain-containing protein, partial [bacterium]|nr:FH2 domain-containing protein [bacterium]
MDPEEVVREFRVDKPKSTIPNRASAGSPEKKKQSRVQHLLDSKRSTNLSIVLSRFKIANHVIQLSIWCMDEEVLEEEDVAVLLTATPTPDEEALLRGHNNTTDLSDLGKPEQYLISVMAIPRLSRRLVAWHYMVRSSLWV